MLPSAAECDPCTQTHWFITLRGRSRLSYLSILRVHACTDFEQLLTSQDSAMHSCPSERRASICIRHVNGFAVKQQ